MSKFPPSLRKASPTKCQYQSLSPESSHGSLSSRPRDFDYPKMGSYLRQDHPYHPVNFLIKPLRPDSPPPKPRRAPGDLSRTRQDPLHSIPSASTSRQPMRDRPHCCARERSGHEDGQGQEQLSWLKTKGIAKVVKGHLNLDEDEEYHEWINVGEEDDEWCIIDKPVGMVDKSEAMERLCKDNIKDTLIDKAVVEQPNIQRLRVHPLFAALYGDDPYWGSMAELEYEQ
ncbi:hypothetical protein F4805DRAFT_208897 [Annulohypoxylon moriforme]|nr:hypothetical protein F4805DRAFT_208897 [Annulohypoxylon moriforme]